MHNGFKRIFKYNFFVLCLTLCLTIFAGAIAFYYTNNLCVSNTAAGSAVEENIEDINNNNSVIPSETDEEDGNEGLFEKSSEDDDEVDYDELLREQERQYNEWYSEESIVTTL